jgi:hypothetical protein
LALSYTRLAGRAQQLCPATDINFLDNLDGIVDLNIEVTNGALEPIARRQ